MKLNIVGLLCCGSMDPRGFDVKEASMPGMKTSLTQTFFRTVTYWINPAVSVRHYCVNCKPQTLSLGMCVAFYSHGVVMFE